MSNPLEKIIELIKKTGDNCVVLNADGEPAYAIMSFDDYQKLLAAKSDVVGLTEDQLLEKINRDIAIWRSSQHEQNLDDWTMVPPEEKVPPSTAQNDKKTLNVANFSRTGADEDETYFFEPID